MMGAKVGYQPGCYSIYRRHGNKTVSTSSKIRHLKSQLIINRKVENNLIKSGKFFTKYQKSLAQSYFLIAREYIEINPSIYTELLRKVFFLDPNFKAISTNRTAIYSLAQNILGFKKIEKLVFTIKIIKKLLRGCLKSG